MLKISNVISISHTVEELLETVINAVVRIPHDEYLLPNINPFVTNIDEYLKRRDDDTKEMNKYIDSFYWNAIDRGASEFVVISEYSNPNYLTPETTPIDICFSTNNNITGMHSGLVQFPQAEILPSRDIGTDSEHLRLQYAVVKNERAQTARVKYNDIVQDFIARRELARHVEMNGIQECRVD